MQINIQDEGNVVSALVVDQLIKTMLIKLDNTLQIQDSQVKKSKQEAQKEIAKIVEECKRKVELSEKQVQIEKDFISQKTEHLKEKIATQTKQIEGLEQQILDRRQDLQHITSYDKRFENLRDLQQNYESLNEMIREHDNQRKYQSKMLAQYTQMIDIGIQKKPRADTSVNTNVSLLFNMDTSLRNITHDGPQKNDAHFVQAMIDPIQVVC